MKYLKKWVIAKSRWIRNFPPLQLAADVSSGASPALDVSFPALSPAPAAAAGCRHPLSAVRHQPAMSDLGYQSSAQSGLALCYNDLASYTESLRSAVATPYPAYAEIGTKDANGEWLQLNTNIIQIENEYYFEHPPQARHLPGERPIQALMSRGVQYVEVR